jgi:hypothetical protein
MKKQLLFLTLFTFNLLIAQVPSYVPTNGLVGYWPFNGNANDISGNGNNGTVTGATLTTDRFGNTNSAYSFDDNSDYINCGNSSTVNITGSITLSAWINATNFNTENGIISKMGGYDLITSANNTIPPLDKIRWLEVGGFLFTNPIQQGTWLHIVATFDLITQTKKVYINGTLFASQAANITSLPTTIENLYIGSHQPLIVPSWSFNGKLDDIGIWNRALTQQEITNLYNSALPPTACLPSYVPTNGLVGFWPFCGNANDVSGNGNNGTTGSGVTLTSDRFFSSNAAYDFNGSGNISLTSLPTIGTQDFTISGWVKTNNTAVRKGIACWGQDNPWQSTYFFVTNTGYLNFGLAYNGGPQSSTFIADNQWHHVAVTCISGLVQLYLDGQRTASALQMNPNISGANKALGANIDNSGSNNFVGALDDIGIWNRALTQAEITGLYTTLSTEQTQANNQISIYPNPAKDQITIDCGTIHNPNGWSYKIVNALGQEVLNGEINNQQNAVSLSSLNGSGVYFVKIYNTSNNLVNSMKIILK